MVAAIIAGLPRLMATRSLHSWLVGAIALVAYAALASPHIVDGDNAEFAALGALGGGAHPSGYPLYILWLRAWSWLPGTTPAHTAALATAILGALALATWHAACRAWGARPLAAALAVAIVGAAPIVVRYHAQAEVFAMNHLVVAVVVWLAGDGAPLSGRWRGAALGLVAGLGLADHLTCVLIAPVGLYGVVRAARESRPMTYLMAVAGLVVGLTPYAYLMAADSPASWGRVTTLPALWATFVRAEYGGAGSFLPRASLPWPDSVAACLVTIGRSWLWLFGVAGVAMLGIRIWRPAGGSRWAWALLAVSFVLAGPVLASRFNVEPRGIGLYVVQRFHLLPTLLLTVPVAAALDMVARLVRQPDRLARLARVLPVLTFGVLVLAALPRLARVHSPAMERGVQNLLRSLPRDAIAVVLSEDQCFGGHYLQFARGERPDVAFVCSELLRRDWYLARWAARGLALPRDAGVPLGEALLATGRPVFIDHNLPALLAGFPSYPAGVLRRLLPRGASPPPASEIAELNRDLYRSFDLDYAPPGRDDDFAAVAHRRYTASWAAIANLLAAAGDAAAARDAVDVARSLQPVQVEP